MKRLLIAGLTAVLTLSASCRSESRGSSTQAPSPTAEVAQGAAPFTVSPPLDAAAAFDESRHTGYSWYVLDLASGRFQLIEPDLSDSRRAKQQGQAGVHPYWIDDDTLAVQNADGQTYLAKLSGEITLDAMPPATPTEAWPSAGQSSDGEWQASQTAVDGPGVVVGTTALGGTPKYKITDAISPQWSPPHPTLALIANWCADPTFGHEFDLELFDPLSGNITELSTSTDQIVQEFAWRPDGAAIAAPIIDYGDYPRPLRYGLLLVDVPSGETHALVTPSESPKGGVLASPRWNPSGTKLLFFRSIGGKEICNIGAPFEPPSEVQRLGD